MLIESLNKNSHFEDFWLGYFHLRSGKNSLWFFFIIFFLRKRDATDTSDKDTFYKQAMCSCAQKKGRCKLESIGLATP